MYKIKLGINNKAIIKPKSNKIYAGVEEKYKKKGTWDSSIRLSRSLIKNLRSQNISKTRAKSNARRKLPRRSEIRELSMNNFDSLTGFENVFKLISKQKKLMCLEVA